LIFSLVGHLRVCVSWLLRWRNTPNGKRLFGSSYTKPTTPAKPFAPLKPEVTPKEAGRKDKGKAIVKGALGSLMATSALNAKGMVISKLISNSRVLTLKEIEEIDQFALELAEEEEVEEEADTVLAPDVG